MKELRLYYNTGHVERKVHVKLYKKHWAMKRSHPARRGSVTERFFMAMCTDLLFIDGHKGVGISFCEEFYCLNLVAHECDHAATKLLEFRHRNWCQRMDCEELHSNIVGDLVEAICDAFGTPPTTTPAYESLR